MPFRKHDRQYDLVLLGANGYTGKYTAEYITKALPTNLKWAVAGRSQSKLGGLLINLTSIAPDRAPPAIEICSLDASGLATLAKKTFIIATLVGPYAAYGEPVFKACAEHGTHYIDVTGEIPFVAHMIKKYEATAKHTGSLMFPQIGLESAPSDLIAWHLAKKNREEFNAQTAEAVICLHRLTSAPSGGTLASLLGIFDNYSLKDMDASTRPWSISPVPNSKLAPKRGISQTLTGVCRVPGLGLLTTLVVGTTDAAIVGRTWGTLASVPSRQEQSYGPNFTFEAYLSTSSWIWGTMTHWIIVIASLLLATIAPLRKLLKAFVTQQGQGPTRDKTHKDEVEYRGVAVPDIPGPVVQKAFCQMQFKGSLYLMAGILIAHAAETILTDDLQLEGGVYTAALLGQKFVDRLDGGGIKFKTSVISV